MRSVLFTRRSSLGLVLAGLASGLLFTSGSTVQANGTIDTTGSSVAAGAAPQQGTVTIEPSAPPGPAPEMPALGSPGTLEAMSGAVPPFPGGGTGADGDFHATADMTLASGVYDFLSYRVDPGVTVTYAHPVTIRTTGDVVLDGFVTAEPYGGDITFECGGDFAVRARVDVPVPTPGVQSHGGAVKIDVAGVLTFSDLSGAAGSATTHIGTAWVGDVEMIARGGAAGAAAAVVAAYITAAGVRMRSATTLRLGTSDIGAFTSGGAGFHAFAGDVEFEGSAVSSSGPVTVEASGAVRTSSGFFNVTASDVRLTAFGGPLEMTGTYVTTYPGGGVRGRAAAGVGLHDGARLWVQEGDGSLEVTAFGGDLRTDLPGEPGLVNAVLHDGTGPTSLTASGAMHLGGSTSARVQADLTLRAFGGALASSGDLLLESLSGSLDIGAMGDVTAEAGRTVRFAGDSLRLVGARLDVTGELAGRVGPVTLTTRDALSATGTLQGGTGFTATSIDGDVTLDDAQITTAASAGARSGDIRIETFAGARGGLVSARGATIRTGDSGTQSGDVLLRVVTVPRPTVRSYLLPTSVSLKLGTSRSAGLRAQGTVGSPDAWLTAASPPALPFTMDVGTRHLEGDLTLRPNGRDREYEGPGVLLRVAPSRTGTSEAGFSLRLDEDLTGKVTPDGFVDFRLQQGDNDFRGSVRLTGGRFKLGSTRGAVSELLYPLAVAAQEKGGGKDSLSFTVGFASDGATPDSLPDVAIEFGDGYSVTVAAADFVRSGDRFVAKKPPSAPGLTLVVVDFDRETVQVKGRNLDLGGLPAGSPVTSRIGVAVGGDIRSVELTLSRKGTKLTY